MSVAKVWNPSTLAWEPVIVGKQGPAGPTGPLAVINTDGDPGGTIYVGSIDPAISYTLAAGDVWIELP